MDSQQSKPIPQLPLLHGEDNYREWEGKTIETMLYYGGDKVIDPATGNTFLKTVAEVHKPFVLGVISSSVTPVMAQLQAAGYDPSKTNQDPMTLYMLINKHFKPVSLGRSMKVAKHLRDLGSKPSELGLKAWKDLIKFSKQALDRAGAPMNNELAICLVVASLGVDFPEFARTLLREKALGKLTWDRLMKKITTKAAQEEVIVID